MNGWFGTALVLIFAMFLAIESELYFNAKVAAIAAVACGLVGFGVYLGSPTA